MVDSTAEEACTLACDDVLEWYWEGIYQGVRKESFGTKVCDIKLNHFRNISGGTMVSPWYFLERSLQSFLYCYPKMIKQLFNLAELVSPYVPQCVESRTRTAGTHNCNWVEINQLSMWD